jgi:hypothetical protein
LSWASEIVPLLSILSKFFLIVAIAFSNANGLMSINVVAKPFPKFFNYEEHKPEDIPNE